MTEQQEPADSTAHARGINAFEVWKEYERVAMHFNDLLMRLRSQSLAAIVAFATLAGVVLRGDIDSGFRWGVLSGVFLLLSLFWVAIWVLDFVYYNRLLLGAVDALLTVEQHTKHSGTITELSLSTVIEAAVAGERSSPGGYWPSAKSRWIFYGIVFAALLGGLAVSLVEGGFVARFGFAATQSEAPPSVSSADARPKLAGVSLFDCSGRETGKVEGWVAQEQLTMNCRIDGCQATFGAESFGVVRNEDGRYSGLSHYFEFDPLSGTVQGIVGSPYYYLVGRCTERKRAG